MPLTGSQIRAIRARLGLSQQQFAELLGVHWVTVSRWERGELTPSPYQIQMMEKFAQAAETKKDVGSEVVKLIVAGAAIAAVFALLNAALGGDKKK